jgi:hypothetical protein
MFFTFWGKNVPAQAGAPPVKSNLPPHPGWWACSDA